MTMAVQDQRIFVIPEREFQHIDLSQFRKKI